MAEFEHIRRPADLAKSPAGRELDETGPAPAVAAPVPVAGVATARRAAGEGADPLGGTRPPGDVVSALQRRRGGGQALAPDKAERFGAHLGTDLSGVRLHRGAEPDAMTRSVGATAFTYGSDVYFSDSAPAGGPSGDHLLAHELAHVAQQGGGAAGGAPVIGRADDPAEAEADRLADTAMSALRRQAVATPEATASDTAGPIRRLAVTELVAIHEAFIKAAGGTVGKRLGPSGGPAPETDTKADTDTGPENDVEAKSDSEAEAEAESETETETGSDVEAKTDTDTDTGPDAKTETETGSDVEAKTDTDTDTDTGPDAKTETETGSDVEAKTDADGLPAPAAENDLENSLEEDKTDADGLPVPAAEAAEAPGEAHPSPTLLARITKHANAVAILARGLPRLTSSAERSELRELAMRMLASDPWVSAMKLLDFQDLYMFVQHRHSRLVDFASKPKEETETKQTATDAEAGAEAAEVGLESGLLNRSDDAAEHGPVDTSESTAAPLGAGWEALVVGEGFEVRMASEVEAKDGDPAAKPELFPEAKVVIRAAVMVKDGIIEKLANAGDRAVPTRDAFAGFLLHLKEAGVSLQFAVSGFTEIKDGTAAQILAEYEAELSDAIAAEESEGKDAATGPAATAAPAAVPDGALSAAR